MPLEVAEPYADDATLDGTDKEFLWTLNFGPQHPATHTTLRLILTLDGERVVKAIPDIGYLHSGFEKLGEDLDYNQYVTIVDRMNYISPIANEVAWFESVEKLMGMELTLRGKYLRVLMAELARISDHLLCCRRRGPRPRGVHGISLWLLPARKALRHFRDGFGSALPPELFPRRRRHDGRDGGLGPAGAGVRPTVSESARRHRPPAQSQSHFR